VERPWRCELVMALTVLIIVTISASRKTIHYATFVIERLQTFAKNFATNAFINVF